MVGAGPAGLEAARVAGERGHTVTVLEAMPWAGGQIRLAARNPRRRDLMGIVEWRVAELDRLGVEVRYDVIADVDDVDGPGTGRRHRRHRRASRSRRELEAGDDLVATSWDVLGGDVTPAGDVLLYDDNGTHSAMSAAEMIARSGARLEIVTPERMLGIEVGGMNHVPYARAFNETDTRITLNQRVLSVRPEPHPPHGRLCVELGSDQQRATAACGTSMRSSSIAGSPPRTGCTATSSPARGISARSTSAPCSRAGRQTVATNPDGRYRLFRIGDAVAGRNIHAAVYDALRLLKDV